MHLESVSILSSGSCGNSSLFQSSDGSVLLDAGVSCRELEQRLSFFGAEPTQVVAVVLTHEHTDHVRGARKFCSKYDIPVYGTRGTLALTPLDGVKVLPISSRQAFDIGPFQMRSFKVRHLAADPIAVSVSIGERRVGVASDLGCVTHNVIDELKSSDVLLIEANYDDNMLLTGEYPEFLKRTIKGDHGHLSNHDAGILAARTATDRTRSVVLVHLSQDNNTPELARSAVEGTLEKASIKKNVDVSEHGLPTGPFRLR